VREEIRAASTEKACNYIARQNKNLARILSFYALIPAAGSGSRVAHEAPKQYLPLLNGKPMLWHAIRAVCLPGIEAVFVVLSAGDGQFARHEWNDLPARVEPLYCGGATRRDSVYNGLIAALETAQPDDWMLVHDAARPCLPRADLERLVSECEHDAVGGLLALPAADTVKRAAETQGAVRSVATEDRSQLWLAQTPQMFRAGVLAQALQRTAGLAVTDEAAALERIGLRPRLVRGSRENIKVTYPEDIAMAQAILRCRA
jgi:2-C-methyl-D-erythritol 4-phosphate cytidylyltransferase